MNLPARRKPPFSSPLWQHLERIKALRKNRVSFQEISNWLAREFEIHRHPTTIANWLNRTRRRRIALPYGIRPESAPKPKVRLTTAKPERAREPLQIIE